MYKRQFSRDLFQPVTLCPASISRGTMRAPMAPRPTNPMFTGVFSPASVPGHPKDAAIRDKPGANAEMSQLYAWRARWALARQGSLSKPSPKPFRLIGKPMPSSGVWKMM